MTQDGFTADAALWSLLAVELEPLCPLLQESVREKTLSSVSAVLAERILGLAASRISRNSCALLLGMAHAERKHEESMELDAWGLW